MEKIFIFNQRSHKKSKLFLLFYCIFLLVVAIFIGTGKFGILDLINSSPMRKGISFGTILGLVLLIPAFVFIKYTRYKIEIRISKNSIKIFDKKNIELAIEDIKKITLNSPRPNTLNLYSKNKLLYTFDTGDEETSLTKISQELLKLAKFDKSITKRKIIGGEIEAIEYIKKK